MSFETVYVAVDAIDESSSRDNLLQTLQILGTDRKFGRLQFVTSSREYFDIEKVMLSFSVSISMNNPAVEDDIRHYVHSNLQSNPQFGRCQRDVLHKAEKSIIDGAGGMYVSPFTPSLYALR